MNIKQLKKAIKDLPDDAEAVFAIWGLEGDKHTFFNFKGGNSKLHPINGGGNAVIVATSDNCRAHKMVSKNGKFHY